LLIVAQTNLFYFQSANVEDVAKYFLSV